MIDRILNATEMWDDIFISFSSDIISDLILTLFPNLMLLHIRFVCTKTLKKKKIISIVYFQSVHALVSCTLQPLNQALFFVWLFTCELAR